MTNLLRKPIDIQDANRAGKFERFNLSENPFPSEPTVNKESQDKRINGNIYEIQIREKEFELIQSNFIKQPQSDFNHLRLGYIIDTSYIGRGNGKSAFLINLMQKINKEFCLDLSDGLNKCFAIYVTPEPGGRTKTFQSFVDSIYDAILKSEIISTCLAILRLEAINELYPNTSLDGIDEKDLVKSVNNSQWYQTKNIQYQSINNHLLANKHLQNLPSDFPIFKRNLFTQDIVSQEDFENYYIDIKRPREKIDFVFSQLVKFFISAGFNGAYILVDDFERIPDFQSTRQKKDFALELRACLYDGSYTNAKINFYNMLLVLHAGVPKLISDAWAASGLENRAPINQTLTFKHIINFGKLNQKHVSLLLRKYLIEYRIDTQKKNGLSPFTEGAVTKIGELSEFNAAKILKMSYELLDKAANIPEQIVIDEDFINKNRDFLEIGDEKAPNIDVAKTVDLVEKAKGQEKV